MGIAEGMSRTVAAIRSAQSEARIVHVEATSHHETVDPALDAALTFTRLRQFLPTDLLLGGVDPGHPLFDWLIGNGASAGTLARLVDHAQRIDVMGTNFYPGMSSSRLVADPSGHRTQGYHGGAPELEAVIRSWTSRYATPVMITETSTIGSVWRRARWMDDSLGLVERLRAEDVPVVGYTSWPLFSLVTWSYRRGRGPVSEYLAHMGLWDLRADAGGNLERSETPLVDRFRRAMATLPTA